MASMTAIAAAAMLSAAPSPVWPVLFVATFALLTAVGYVLHFRTLSLAPPPPSVPTAPPAERARAALAAAAPLAEIDVRAYYGCIGAAIRAYLVERFALPEHAMPRAEMEARMSCADVAAPTAALAADLLERCDAVRLGRAVPASSRRAADLAAAREIIELTATR